MNALCRRSTAVRLAGCLLGGSTWAAAEQARMLNGSMTLSANLPSQDTVLAYLQLVLRQTAMSRSSRGSRRLHGRFALGLGAQRW